MAFLIIPVIAVLAIIGIIIAVSVYHAGFEQGRRVASYNPSQQTINNLQQQLNNERARTQGLNSTINELRFGSAPGKPLTTPPKKPEGRHFQIGDKVQLTEEAAKRHLTSARIKTKTGVVRHVYNFTVEILRDGKKTPESYRHEELEIVDAACVNIFADYLEEHGCPQQWTDMLRKGFPM